jgi:hypothetical protein
MNGFNRETILPSLDFTMLSCPTCSKPYHTDFDGWLGIAPHNSKYNFLHQLSKVHEVIDNEVVMLNIDMTRGNSSIVKFGGFDKTELGLSIFKSMKYTKYPWNIATNFIKFSEENIE